MRPVAHHVVRALECPENDCYCAGIAMGMCFYGQRYQSTLPEIDQSSVAPLKGLEIGLKFLNQSWSLKHVIFRPSEKAGVGQVQPIILTHYLVLTKVVLSRQPPFPFNVRIVCTHIRENPDEYEDGSIRASSSIIPPSTVLAYK